MWENLKTNGFMYFAILILILTIGMCATAEAEEQTPDPPTTITDYEREEARLVKQFNGHIKEFSLTVTGNQWKMFTELMDEVEELDKLRIDESYRDGIRTIFKDLMDKGFISDEQLAQYACETK